MPYVWISRLRQVQMALLIVGSTGQKVYVSGAVNIRKYICITMAPITMESMSVPVYSVHSVYRVTL